MKELGQRFDFKGSHAEVTFNEKDSFLQVAADDDYKLKAVIDILKGKCVKRHVSLKAFTYGKVESALGGTVRQRIVIQNGITDEQAKAITKSIKESKLKAQAQIQDDHVRVQSKSKDILQTVIVLLKNATSALTCSSSIIAEPGSSSLVLTRPRVSAVERAVVSRGMLHLFRSSGRFGRRRTPSP